jgi:VWFA-related protein
MKKLASLLLLLAVCAATLPVWAQTPAQRTRPRRVGDARPAPTPEPTPEDVAGDEDETPAEPAPTTARRPPVLGGTTTGPRPTASPTVNAPPSNAPVEVEEDEVVRVNTTLVTVPVSVLDRSGKYIPNLRQRDFQLMEDGVPQEIAYFSATEAPFTVALVLDTSGSTKFKIDEMQDAAIAFINQLRADDKVMVVSFDDKINVLCEPTNDRRTLSEAIRRIRVGEGTKLYDAIDYVMNTRFSRISGRKAMVLFTDGVDTTSKRASYQSTVQDAEELDALIYPVQYDTYTDVSGGNTGGSGGTWPGSGTPRRRSGGGLWGVLGDIISGGNVSIGRSGGSVGGAGTSREDYQRADTYLGELSDKTGARRYRADTMGDLNQAFGLVAEELRRQYSIGYYPKNSGQASTRRSIRVRVNRPELVVRARDSYIYTGGNGPQDANNAPANKPVLRRQP